MSDALPPSLLARIASDAAEAAKDLSSPDLSAATASSRTLASRRLLSLTPRALSTLERLTSPSISEKVQLGAAQEILRRSPATRDDLDSSSPVLPPALAAAFTSIFSSLAGALNASSAPPDRSLLCSYPATPAPAPAPAPAAEPVAEPSAGAGASGDSDTTFILEEEPMLDEPLAFDDLPDATDMQMTSAGLLPTKEKKPVAKKKPAAPRKKAK